MQRYFVGTKMQVEENNKNNQMGRFLFLLCFILGNVQQVHIENTYTSWLFQLRNLLTLRAQCNTSPKPEKTVNTRKYELRNCNCILWSIYLKSEYLLSIKDTYTFRKKGGLIIEGPMVTEPGCCMLYQGLLNTCCAKSVFSSNRCLLGWLDSF